MQQDPLEKGQRKLLNLGHTLGHALESCWMKQGLLRPHGLCVVLGILAETRIAIAKQICSADMLDQLEPFVVRAFNLKGLALPAFDALLEFVNQDKKNSSGNIRLVLLKSFGIAEIDVVTSPQELAEAWNTLRSSLIA